MTHHTHHHQPNSLVELIAVLSESSPVCDPDFDDGLEELERQFAELRLTFDHEYPEETNA